MTATPYLVSSDNTKSGHTIKAGVDAIILSANSSAEAKAMAESLFAGDGQRSGNLDVTGKWAAATPVSLADVDDWNGWTITCNVNKAATTAINTTTTASGVTTFATFIAAVVTALNATSIDHASFTTDTLTVATGSGGDGIGDRNVDFALIAPDGTHYEDLYVSAVTDNGAGTAALSVAFIANGTLPRTVTPKVVGSFH